MKLLRASLLALFLASPSASVASFYFGVRLDVPVAFEQVAQTTNTIVLPMIGVQAGLDFDSASSGPGFRLALSSQLISQFRTSADVYFRLPIEKDFSSYVGVGASLLLGGQVLLGNAHVLAGLEYQLAPGIGLFAEVSPGYALGYGRNSCFGALNPDPNFVCGSLLPFMLESAVGLNFRF
jgi:hypothetical protein